MNNDKNCHVKLSINKLLDMKHISFALARVDIQMIKVINTRMVVN